ncbi:sentrin-specific protease 7 isoform X3 [Narcine bancroftii]|uniref:sentrin-specific protease 7 isoform X3 n=1 Tax=Narcine bancroftii TaxID=1343680 RepID=UPI0038315BF7
MGRLGPGLGSTRAGTPAGASREGGPAMTGSATTWMERRRVSTQSTGEDHSGTFKIGGKFRIPKKKKISEMDNVETHSPLSRLADSRIENLKASNNYWPLSYNTLNKTRNHRSIPYNQRKNYPSRCNFPGDVQLKEPRIMLRDVLMTDSGRQHLVHLKKGDCSNVENTDTSHAKHYISATNELTDLCHEEIKTSHHDSQPNILSSSVIQLEKKLEYHIRKQNETTRPKEEDISALRNSKKEVEGMSRIKQTEKGDNLCEHMKINERQCKVDLPKDALTDLPFPSPKKKRLCLELEDHPVRREINRAACSRVECTFLTSGDKDLLKTLLLCLNCKEQIVNCHCLSNKEGEKDRFVEITKTESGLQQKLLSPLNTKQQSPHHRNQEPSAPDGVINWKESPSPPESNGQKTEALVLNLPTLNPQIKPLKPAVVSSEPIVLSSDEEDTDKMQSGLQCTTLTPEISSSHLRSKSLSTDNSQREAEIQSAKREPESIKPCTMGQNICEANVKDTLSNAVQITDGSLETSTMTTTTLDLDFAALHVGEIEGSEQGSVTFGPDYIAISLTDIGTWRLDTSQLKKYSMWERLCDSTFEKHSVIFLWFAADYMDEINKQLKISSLIKESGVFFGDEHSEYIFIQLFKPLQAIEATLLKETMTFTGVRNETADLCEVMSLEEAYLLLAKLDFERSSFLLSCYKTLQQRVETATLLPDYQMSQEEIAHPTRVNNYTLCHVRRKDHYVVSLASKQEKQKHVFSRNGPVQKIIVFPPPPTKGGLAVTSEDLECLEEGEFLNDVIIDFYLKYLLLEKAPKELAERTHIFSSFFYRRLTRKDNAEEETNSLSIQQKRHQRVKTWTRHVDIFTKDFIFVPVNEESHWYLAVICFPGLDKIVYESGAENKLLEELNRPGSVCGGNWTDEPDLTHEPFMNRFVSNPSATHSNSENTSKDQISLPDETDDKDSSTVPCVRPLASPNLSIQECIKVPKSLHQQSPRILKQPCILIMDSLRAASQLLTVKILQEYLQIEWEVKKGGQHSFTADKMKGSVPRVPKQDNSSDCGIYLLQYVESFFQNPITNFELPLQLDKWFLRQEVKKKREEIQDLILHLHNQQRADGE